MRRRGHLAGFDYRGIELEILKEADRLLAPPVNGQRICEGKAGDHRAVGKD